MEDQPTRVRKSAGGRPGAANANAKRDGPFLPVVSIPKDGTEPAPYFPSHLAGAKPLPDELYQHRIGLVAAMRHDGLSYDEITDKTGLSRAQIQYAMVRARRAGLNEAQIAVRLDDVALPRAVENLIGILEDEDHPNHWQATESTLRGRGAFRNHSHAQHESKHVNLNLTVEYEMPGGVPVPAIVQLTEDRGLIVGTPRSVEAADGDSDRAR